MTPLLRLGPRLLAAAGVPLPEGHCISVFADLSNTRKLLVQDAGDKVGGIPSAVVLHRATLRPNIDRSAPCIGYPSPCGLVRGPKLRESTPAERSPFNACSKIGGAPGWIQDDIAVPGCAFLLQVSARMLAMAGAREDPLRGGLGYVFLSRALRPGIVGHFFAQMA